MSPSYQDKMECRWIADLTDPGNTACVPWIQSAYADPFLGADLPSPPAAGRISTGELSCVVSRALPSVTKNALAQGHDPSQTG